MSRTQRPIRHDIELEVRYAETDQMGVVHHANYLVWFELARTALCTQSGYPYSQIEDELGVWLMVSRVHVSYRGGARYGDRVRVGSWIEKLKSRALHFGYEVLRDDECLVTGVTEHIWVDRESRRPRRIPAELEGPFGRLFSG